MVLKKILIYLFLEQKLDWRSAFRPLLVILGMISLN